MQGRGCGTEAAFLFMARAGEGASRVCSPSQELLLSAAPISPSISSHPSLPLSLSFSQNYFSKEKRKRQTEIEGKRQQLEDQILQLQHFKVRD